MIRQCIYNKFLSKQMRTSFSSITKLTVILLFFLTTAISSEAQEYASDRLFIKEHIKT